jgi:hypothetical protein
MIAILCSTFVAIHVFRYDDGENKTDLAKAGTKTLETGVESFRRKFGEYPRKLEDLVDPPDGDPYSIPLLLTTPGGSPISTTQPGHETKVRSPTFGPPATTESRSAIGRRHGIGGIGNALPNRSASSSVHFSLQFWLRCRVFVRTTRITRRAARK